MKATSKCTNCQTPFEYEFIGKRLTVCGPECLENNSPHHAVVAKIRAQTQNVLYQFIRIHHEEEIKISRIEALEYVPELLN